MGLKHIRRALTSPVTTIACLVYIGPGLAAAILDGAAPWWLFPLPVALMALGAANITRQ